MTYLLQDAAGCAETRRYARWFADRPEAMWLLRKANNERGMTTMTTPDLTEARRLAGDFRCHSASRSIDDIEAAGEMLYAMAAALEQAQGQRDAANRSCNYMHGEIVRLSAELERLRAQVATFDDAITWATHGVEQIISERDALRAQVVHLVDDLTEEVAGEEEATYYRLRDGKDVVFSNMIGACARLLAAPPAAPAQQAALNLACHSVQARLAAQWGYVRPERAESTRSSDVSKEGAEIDTSTSLTVGDEQSAAFPAIPAKRLTPFDAVERAMDLAALYCGSVAMNDREQTAAYRGKLRAHLMAYIYPDQDAPPASAAPSR